MRGFGVLSEFLNWVLIVLGFQKKKKKPSGIGRDELWSSFQVPLSPSQHNSSASICFVNGFPCVKQKIIAKYLRKFWSRQL